MKTDTLIRKLLKAPPSQWEAITDKALAQVDAHEVSRAMEDDAGRLAFLAEYLYQRQIDRNHAVAAKKANAVARRVNKAMGYDFPDRRAFRI